ncbi:GTP-binding protein [Toxoplasma gondii p89]|uniref:GTP-binding protein n=1 Tax=Toxoplasma gondii p89 TaxID=943119 RepID=A0A086K035_TOXGO|nr:GTP-binding protein [Toxoplasma gondii p89]
MTERSRMRMQLIRAWTRHRGDAGGGPLPPLKKPPRNLASNDEVSSSVRFSPFFSPSRRLFAILSFPVCVSRSEKKVVSPALSLRVPPHGTRAPDSRVFPGAHAVRLFSTGAGRRSARGRRRAAAVSEQAEDTGDADADNEGDPQVSLVEQESRMRFWQEEQEDDGLPLLARPFVHAFQPREFLNREDLPWLSPEQRKYSRILFGKPIAAHPVLVAQTLHKLPHNPWPQVAAVGHSNVGKSSLLNALMHGRDVARSCSKPGRTRHLFTFDLGNHLSLVDLPGYGFARVKPQLKEEWAILIEEYFTRSKQLRRVLSLVDATKGVEALDERLWQLLAEKNLPFQVVLTKADLLTARELHAAMFDVLSRLQTVEKKETLLHPFVHAVSSRHNHGIPELRASLAAVASDWRKRQGLPLLKFQGQEDSPVRRHR